MNNLLIAKHAIKLATDLKLHRKDPLGAEAFKDALLLQGHSFGITEEEVEKVMTMTIKELTCEPT